MRKIFIIALVPIVFLASCSPKVLKDDLIIVDLMGDLTIKTELKLSDMAEDIKYTKLDSYPGCFIQRADKFSLSDDYILVYDRNQAKIFLFNRDGRFIKEISRQGNGPGEFNRPNDVRISHNGEYILIHNQKDVNRYNFDGELLGTTPLPSWAVQVDTYEDGIIGFYPSWYSSYMDNYSMVTFDWEGTITGQYGKRNWDWLKQGNPMMQTRVYYFDGAINFHENYYDTVYCLTDDKAFRPRIFFNCENKPLRDPDQIAIPFYQRTDIKGFYRHGWVETPQYIFITGSLDRQYHQLVYSKNEDSVTHAYIPEQKANGIPNDLDGGAPFWPDRYENGKMYRLEEASRLRITLESESILSNKYKNQKLRDKFLDFRDSLSEDDGYVLTEVTLR